MILSFHPCVIGDKNILCAGRDPDESDLKWIRAADAVILPQGCLKSLFEMASRHCAHVFPDYQARFAFPGKTGQAKLFHQCRACFPNTICFSSLAEYAAFTKQTGGLPEFDLPFVFKFDWGGESDNVLLIRSQKDLEAALGRAAAYEKTGQYGFLIQDYIPTENRSLRVVIIGAQKITYWRVQPDPSVFSTGFSKGAEIDLHSDPGLMQMGADMVADFCRKTNINLAGFDLIFSNAQNPRAYFLEINYFFGRTGLGGSNRFYQVLNFEINQWLKGIGLTSEVHMPY